MPDTPTQRASRYLGFRPPTRDELDTVEMCTDVQGARLGCQMVIRADVALDPLNA